MIGRELGRGMTARVYVAEDVMLARPVAIKFISNLDASARQRFLLEARAVAKIRHPNVVDIHRVGTLKNRPYFVTELVRGESLASLDKPVPSRAALDIAIGVARGLAAAHRRNVVHCDLKPSNVMIDPDGVAKIIDFGLARIVADGARSPHAPVGTPDYMAPEVWQGETPSQRADVYSLGALLFELLAGAPPFADVEPAALRQRVTSAEAPVLRDRAPDAEPGLAEVIARCLRRDREARFADGDEVREALERLHASHRHTVRRGENPYRGLLPFEASHRGVFFGRRSEVDAVVGRLRGEPVVLVTGDSGVGKSSLCRAGVVPAVVDGELGGTWRSLVIVPGARPLTALATALGDAALVPALRESPALLARELRRHAGDGGLIVFVDQLEELITLGDPGEVAALDAALAGLMDGVPGLRLLGSVRADFLARFSTLPGLGRDLSRLLYFLRPLPAERLRDVIVGPATAVGSRFESDAIVDELVKATAAAGSGGLPLLSFALADLWEAREHDVISHGAVAAMGGVAGALSRHADVVIRGMTTANRALARTILLRLVSAMGTRARRGAHELEVGAAAREVLDALVTGRLVVVHDDEREAVYELAHECLLTGWPMLRQWLDADTAGRATRERLAAAAAEWVRLGRRADATWQGTRLEEAAALDATSLSASDLAFVSASKRVARRRRRQRWLIAASAVLLVVLAYSTQRYLARRELMAAVDLELVQARRAFDDAERAADTHDKLVQKAFAEFDARHLDDGELVWRDALAGAETAEAAYRLATLHVEVAFARDPTRGDVRDLIGDISLNRALLAERVHDLHQRDEQIGRLALYDADDSRRTRWNTPASVSVRAPDDATITIEPGGHRATGSAALALEQGSYVATIAAPGRVPTRAPFLAERDGKVAIDVDPPRSSDVPLGFIYIPRGEFLFGNASEDDRNSFFATTPLRRRETDGYLIARTEVTFADWLAFLEALPDKQRDARLPGVASRVSGGLSVTREAPGRWRIELQPEASRYTAGWGALFVYPARARQAVNDWWPGWDLPPGYPRRAYQAVQNWLRFPVVGVSGEDASAYAEWLARTERIPGARLCTEIEWERAARGADDRAYSGGRALGRDDANVDVTHGPGMMGPDEVGSHPASRSPFGLEDMTGNAFEWTISERGGYILRSGSYQHDRKTAHLTNRSSMNEMVRDAALGFRLCATPPIPR